MKLQKISMVVSLLLVLTMVAGCVDDTLENNETFPDSNFSITSYQSLRFHEDGTFKILQFTDLHLTYGFDYNDRQTYRLIRLAVEQEAPDLIVFTGDQTMSPMNKRLYRNFARRMERLNTPWTFVFGNHDDEVNGSKLDLASIALRHSEQLIFQVGPKNITGVGNFLIHLKDSVTNDYRFTLYFIDSNAHRTYVIDGQKKFWYDYIYEDQIAWYEAMVNQVSDHVGSLTPSIAFFHIPLPEYLDVVDNESLIQTGVRKELPCAPYTNTGMFAKMVELGSTKAVFVGHDHINDYTFVKEGITLGYGRATGFNGYGGTSVEKGARIIEINQNGTFTTNVISTKDIGGW
ncbi:MAG TPA: metallophosphoesterase family protein [Bacilli bacterium]|nr:metallophosphoesterase family protein [Bacilli bacterium]